MPVLERLQKGIYGKNYLKSSWYIAREEDIRKIKDRMENQYKIKDRELHNTQEKIQISNKELK